MKVSDVFLKAYKLKVANPNQGCYLCIKRVDCDAGVWTKANTQFEDLFEPEDPSLLSWDWYWWAIPCRSGDYLVDPDFEARCLALLLAYEIAKDEEKKALQGKKKGRSK